MDYFRRKRPSSIFVFLIVLIAILPFASMASAQTFCVPEDMDLQDALDIAKTNDEDDVIRIIQGTYVDNFIYAATDSEPYGVTIEGGYTSGCAIATRVVDPENTVLDGRGTGTVLVLSAPDVAVDFVVDGLTIQNGNVTGYNGGGLYLNTDRGNTTLTNNVFDNNIQNGAGSSGGGAYIVYPDSVTLVNNTFSSNNSEWAGGGLFIAMPVSLSSRISLINNTFNNNNSETGGGGAYVSGNTEIIEIVGNVFSTNSAVNGAGFELASGNSGDRSITITNNIVHNNFGSSQGGGIFIGYGVNLYLINNTIIGNDAPTGGGISLRPQFNSTIAYTYNNIIWNNTANVRGDDLHIWNDLNFDHNSSPVYLYNNDFNHQSPEGIWMQIPFPIDSSNLDNANPLFVPATDDYHLTVDSPCIDAGDDTAPELPTTDKDSNPRIVNSHVDIGAYEYQGLVAPVAGFSASFTSGGAPLTVNFTDESTGTIDTWDWEFGDSSSSSERNPTYDYSTPGVYTVSLTVSGAAGSDIETKTNYITVVSPDAPDVIGACKEFHSYEYGARIAVKVNVENSGNQKTEPFKVAFYLLDGASPDEFLGDETIRGGLNPWRSKVVSLRYEPVSPISGRYIRVDIDPDSQVLELDEMNNTVFIRIP